MAPAEHVADILGGRSVLRRTVRTWRDLERAVREGLPRRALQSVARRVIAPGASVSAFVYGVVPPATFKRRARLTHEESERTERLARIAALAEQLWRNPQEARAFLNRPHPLLDDDTPLAVARTELGARRVERLLNDIEHGLPL